MKNKIAEARTKAGLTQAELSKITGILQGRLSEYESGKHTDNITLKNARKLAEALKTTVDELFPSQT